MTNTLQQCQIALMGGSKSVVGLPLLTTENWLRVPEMHKILLIAAGMLLSAGAALSQQPVRPLPKVGSCPFGYYSSGNYCVPNKSGNTSGAIEKSGNSCPFGFYASGNYCLSSPGNEREAIQKTGNSCPFGWYSSGSYCVKHH